MSPLLQVPLHNLLHFSFPHTAEHKLYNTRDFSQYLQNFPQVTFCCFVLSHHPFMCLSKPGYRARAHSDSVQRLQRRQTSYITRLYHKIWSMDVDLNSTFLVFLTTRSTFSLLITFSHSHITHKGDISIS